MRIGLIGAPGSGKSKFSKRLKKELGDFPIVDNYVPKLAKTTGLAYGHFANYVDNMAVAFKRRELEQSVAPGVDNNLIACGTILDTVTYAFNIADLPVNREELAYKVREMDTIMKAHGWLYTQMFTYDVGFYLPHPDNTRQDQALRATMESFFPPVVLLKKEKVDEQVKSALSVIAVLDAPAEATDPQK